MPETIIVLLVSIEIHFLHAPDGVRILTCLIGGQEGGVLVVIVVAANSRDKIVSVIVVLLVLQIVVARIPRIIIYKLDGDRDTRIFRTWHRKGESGRTIMITVTSSQYQL